VASIPCFHPDCEAYMKTGDVRKALCDWDMETLEKKSEEKNMTVLLAAKAQLFCQCGAVAVIMEEDVGSGVVVCLCTRQYCIGCGNLAHPGNVCPPSKKNIVWLEKNSKPCPNCQRPIQKNGGCSHMTCPRSCGCGYEFCWICMGRYPCSNGCPLFPH
jgi:ariadne-1